MLDRWVLDARHFRYRARPSHHGSHREWLYYEKWTLHGPDENDWGYPSRLLKQAKIIEHIPSITFAGALLQRVWQIHCEGLDEVERLP